MDMQLGEFLEIAARVLLALVVAFLAFIVASFLAMVLWNGFVAGMIGLGGVSITGGMGLVFFVVCFALVVCGVVALCKNL